MKYLWATSTPLYEWQELTGSIIGVLGAVAVAFLGFVLNHFYSKHKVRRENIRSAEITLALGLNEIYDIEGHLKDFLERLNRAVLQPLRGGVGSNQYFFGKTNFPFLNIHMDSSLLKAEYKSYYIHNKILIIYKSVEQINYVFKQMKDEYESIADTGTFLVAQGATPLNQRSEYLANNQSFSEFVQDILKQLQIAKNEFAKTKIYNLKFLTKKRLAVWRLEGVSFKFFRNRTEIEKYNGQLSCLDRIDEIIQKEAEQVMREAEERRTDRKIYVGETLWDFLQKCLLGILRGCKQILTLLHASPRNPV